MAPTGVTEGRIIHYVPRNEELKYAPYSEESRPHVAGVIVKVWSPAGYINATIFPDGSNTGLVDEGMVLWRTSISYDEGKTQGTWHYPEPTP